MGKLFRPHPLAHVRALEMYTLSKALIVGVLIGLLGLIFLPFGFELEEYIGLDILFKLRGKREVPSDLVIVNMDKDSAKKLNLPRNPRKWPRSFHARLVESLVEEGASVIVFDVFFDESHFEEDDGLFAKAIKDAGNVVLCEYLEQEVVKLTDDKGKQSADLNIERKIPPIPKLAQAAIALAPFILPKVPVKVYQYWAFKKESGDTPTLPVVAFHLFAQKAYDDFLQLLIKVNPDQINLIPDDMDIETSNGSIEKQILILRNIFEKEPWIAEKMLKELDDLRTPHVEGEKRRMLKALIKMYQGKNSRYLNFYGPPGSIDTISYYKLLQHQNQSFHDREKLDLEGKAVFVGFSERLRNEQKDGYYTVFSQTNGLDISGVEIVATAFSNLLEEMPVQPLSPVACLAIIFIWGGVLGVLCIFFQASIAAMSIIVLSTIFLIVSQYQFNNTGVWYPLITPIFFQAPIAFFGTVLWKYFYANKERQNVRKALGYFLPDELLDKLAKDVANIRAKSRIFYGICLFTDVKEYTALSETMAPKELSSFLNKYYEVVFKPVKQHGGVVSDVKGDSMLAIWATANPDVTCRNQACLAALDIEKAVYEFNQTSGALRLPTRIGLHAGPMSLGTIGAIDHYEYRPVGDIVNTSSRIEGLNKYLGTWVLVSEEVLYQLDGFLTREVGKFILAGKSNPIVIHELICRMEEVDVNQKTLCDIFAKALSAYRKQSWEEAIMRFEEAIKIYGKDGPSTFYLELCEKYKEDPPGEMRDGLICITNK